MVLFAVARGNNDLLQEGQRFVDVIGLLHSGSGLKLFGSFITSKIDKMQLWMDDFFGGFHLWFALDIDGINWMSSATMIIHFSCSKSFLGLSLEKIIKGLLLVSDFMLGQTSDMDFSFGVVLDGDAGSSLLSWLVRE